MSPPPQPSRVWRTASARAEIHAPADRVWSLMVDASRYGDWNPFIIQIDGTDAFVEGVQVTLQVRLYSGDRLTTSRETITRVSPPSASQPGELAYVYTDTLSRFGMVLSHRTQQVQITGPNRCIWTTIGSFGGWLWPFIPLRRVQAGFDAHGQALKHHAESDCS